MQAKEVAYGPPAQPYSGPKPLVAVARGVARYRGRTPARVLRRGFRRVIVVEGLDAGGGIRASCRSCRVIPETCGPRRNPRIRPNGAGSRGGGGW